MWEHKSERKTWQYVVNGKSEVLTVNQWLKSLLSCLPWRSSTKSHPQTFLITRGLSYIMYLSVALIYSNCNNILLIYKTFICYLWNIGTPCFWQKHCNATYYLVHWNHCNTHCKNNLTHFWCMLCGTFNKPCGTFRAAPPSLCHGLQKHFSAK